nr:glycosyltransferase [uncultured Macellibacteroides sp.]
MKKKSSSVCCVFNYGSHYRTSVYQLMDKELKCDFYFGDYIPGNIKAMDYKSLIGFKNTLKNVWIIGNYYWQCNSVGIVFKPYKHIIMEGEPYCVSSWLILFLAKLSGKKTYTWTHGWYGRESVIKKLIKKIFFSMAHHILLYGDYAKELMLKEGFDTEKLTCIYNSLDYDNQLAIREKLKPSTIYSDYFKNGNKNLMFVGRLTQSKRFDLLLQALSKLKSQSYNFNLTLIGNGEAKEKLMILTKKLGLENNVWFYGACYDDQELSALIYNADICVSPGNIGLTAMHAMVYGTPVITHDNYKYQGPEFEAVRDGITGTFFEYGNSDSLAESIIRWFKKSTDRDAIRKNCYNIIDTRYNPHCQVSHLKKIINE